MRSSTTSAACASRPSSPARSGSSASRPSTRGSCPSCTRCSPPPRSRSPGPRRSSARSRAPAARRSGCPAASSSTFPSPNGPAGCSISPGSSPPSDPPHDSQERIVLVVLGFLMIAVFMSLIMSKRATPVAALILVPVAFGIAAGAGTGIGDMVMESLTALAPTAALLFFAITYFGIMIDVGLFDPLIRKILRLVGHDPVKVVLGTAALTAVVSLDGDGSTTFIIVTSALLPIYLRLRMSPVVLTCVTAITNGVLNVVPWGGPTARAAAALKVSPTDIFVPMIPSMIAGILAVLVLAWLLGRSERKRIGRATCPPTVSPWRAVPRNRRRGGLRAEARCRRPPAAGRDGTAVCSWASAPPGCRGTPRSRDVAGTRTTRCGDRHHCDRRTAGGARLRPRPLCRPARPGREGPPPAGLVQ